MKSIISFAFLLIISKCFKTSSEEICTNGHIVGGTSFRDEDVPSLAKIVEVKTNEFICRTVLIKPHQYITTPCCVQDDHKRKRNVYDIAIVLKHFNQNKTLKQEVKEIHVHSEWENNPYDIETRVALIITEEKAPFEFYIFTSCLRQFIVDQKNEKIHSIIDPCQQGRRVKRQFMNNTWVESRFAHDTGALYVHYHNELILFGMFRSSTIDENICEERVGSKVADVYKFFKCDLHSKTTVAGSAEIFCSGDKIFEENFDVLDNQTWRHEHSLAGGGTWEFQWYSPNQNNSFVRDGILHLRPTLTSDSHGEKYLTKGIAKIPSAQCTYKNGNKYADFFGCERHGRYNVINPVMSASITTINSFAFKYGTVEIRAKMSTGDWLKSSISLSPKRDIYGSWPASGQIDLAEIRGNRNLSEDNVNIGIERVACTLQFGHTVFNTQRAYGVVDNSSGFGADFHIYKLIWTPESISMFVDEYECIHINTDESLWKKYHFFNSPWAEGEPLAPFDQEFFISLSLHVGGNAHSSDEAVNVPAKPWKNDSPHAVNEFWNAKDDWLPTWNDEDVDFQVDYVRVYAT